MASIKRLPFNFGIYPIEERQFERMSCDDTSTLLSSFEQRIQEWDVPVAIYMFSIVPGYNVYTEKLAVLRENGQMTIEVWSNQQADSTPLELDYSGLNQIIYQETMRLSDLLLKLENVPENITVRKFDETVAVMGDGVIRPREIIMYVRGGIERFYVEPSNSVKVWFDARGISTLYELLEKMHNI
jgi:hypothetical protein